MFESVFVFLQANVLPLGFWGVFAASVAEEVIAPIPSALVMMASGFLFVSGPVSLTNIWKLIYFVGLPAGFGVAVGSLPIYAAAYFGGKPILEKWGKYLGLYWTDVERLRERLEEKKNDGVAIIGARILPVVPSVAISALCGFIRMKVWKYFYLTFIGMFLRGLVMGVIGWQVGNVYVKYADMLSKFEDKALILIIAIGVGGLAYLVLRRRQRMV
jgi:membrane protein DedA with SNARE-associated domain